MTVRSARTRLVSTVALLVLLLTLAPVGTAQAGGVEVLPAGQKHYGFTYERLSSRWWEWAFEIPLDRNPLFDQTGALCGEGQRGRVWFLAGVLNESGTAIRDQCVVPARRALFIPILNSEADNLGVDPPLTVAQMRAIIHAALDTATVLSLTVDGQSLPIYRIDDGLTFSYKLPEHDIYEAFGLDFPRQIVHPAVSGGYYTLIAPLPVGEHTIHIVGANSGGFALDVTYHLTVA